MRHKNSVSQTNIERDKEIGTLFQRAKSIAGNYATMERISEIATNLPTSKFYISEYWASRYVQDRINGKRKTFKSKRKGYLYNALYNSFMRVSAKKEYKHLSVESRVFIALEQPAPFIGLSTSTFRRYLIDRMKFYQINKQ